MNLRSLVLCSDEKILRVLRRVLGDLEIAMEECSDSDSAVRQLTRKRFEAVIVDCDDEELAAQVLACVRSAPCNKRSIAVAMIDGQKALRSAFALGAHFVLYKPISAERARTSFRAAYALMKCERRRNIRIAMQIPVTLIGKMASGQKAPFTSDIGLGGMSLKLARRSRNSGPLRIRFTLPGTEHAVECGAQVAWEGSGSQAGIRFVDVPADQWNHLKEWLARHSNEIAQDDPPTVCKLTDLSLGGCYLEMLAPFPVHTRVVLTMNIAKLEGHVEGRVRVMHPEHGMGVEFTRTTQQQRERLEKFIQALNSNKDARPELLVAPEGLGDDDEAVPQPPSEEEIEDPLLDLFRRSSDLTPDSFQAELHQQRSTTSTTAHSVSA